MHGKGKTPHGRVNPAAKQFDLACVAQTKKEISKDKKLLCHADHSPGRIWMRKHSLLDYFRSRREYSKR
jgi:hypothetical protein